jgi:hypothetical protein
VVEYPPICKSSELPFPEKEGLKARNQWTYYKKTKS